MLVKRAQAEPSMVVGGDEMTARRDSGRLADNQAAGTAQPIAWAPGDGVRIVTALEEI
jgi:hypothetical protein